MLPPAYPTRSRRVDHAEAKIGDAILFLEMEPAPNGTRAGFWLSTYGLDAARLAEVRERFGRIYDAAMATADANA